MAKLLRWSAYGLGTVLGLLLIAACAVWVISWQKLNAAPPARLEQLSAPTAAELSDANRMAWTLGCFSCHGDGLRGRKMFDEPMIGRIWAPNLTRVAQHATDQQLARAIRQGIGADGRPLLVMPSEMFQHLSNDNVAALVAMIRRLPEGGAETPRNSYGPLGRLGIALGRFKTAPALVAEYSTRAPILVGAQYEAGRQLAITRCSACHGPSLEGKEAAPGEVSPDLTIAGAYDLPGFTKLLRSGTPAGGRKLPMMGPTARSDLSHLTDSEIAQLHAYLVARAGWSMN